MSELGQLLKKARTDRGLSLDDLQETTKIQKRYLSAIEEGNYKILPGSFYVRAFIKSYAEAVGLEPNEVLHKYRSVIPSPESELAGDLTIRTRRASVRNSDKWSRWITGILLWSFVILIAGIIYYYVSTTYNGSGEVLDNGDTRITDKAEPAPVGPPAVAAPPENKPVTPPVQEPPKPKPDVRLLKSEGGVDFYEVLNADKVTLEMKVTGDRCWVQVDELPDNGKKTTKEAKNLVTGDTRLWETEHSFYVTVGKANAIEVKVNGIDIPTGELPNPKRFQFDRSGA